MVLPVPLGPMMAVTRPRRDVHVEAVENRPAADRVAQIADLDDGGVDSTAEFAGSKARNSSAMITPRSFPSTACRLPAAARPLSLARRCRAAAGRPPSRRVPPQASKRRVLQRASVAEGERPRQRPGGVHQAQMQRRVGRALAARQECDAGHRRRARGASASARSPRRPARARTSWRSSCPAITMFGLSTMPSRTMRAANR